MDTDNKCVAADDNRTDNDWLPGDVVCSDVCDDSDDANDDNMRVALISGDAALDVLPSSKITSSVNALIRASSA